MIEIDELLELNQAALTLADKLYIKTRKLNYVLGIDPELVLKRLSELKNIRVVNIHVHNIEEEDNLYLTKANINKIYHILIKYPKVRYCHYKIGCNTNLPFRFRPGLKFFNLTRLNIGLFSINNIPALKSLSLVLPGLTSLRFIDIYKYRVKNLSSLSYLLLNKERTKIVTELLLKCKNVEKLGCLIDDNITRRANLKYFTPAIFSHVKLRKIKFQISDLNNLDTKGKNEVFNFICFSNNSFPNPANLRLNIGL